MLVRTIEAEGQPAELTIQGTDEEMATVILGLILCSNMGDQTADAWLDRLSSLLLDFGPRTGALVPPALRTR